MEIDKQELVLLIEEAIDRKFGHLIVPPDEHHRDHLIVKDIDTSLLEFMKVFHKLFIDARSIGISTILRIIIPILFALIIGGIILWFKTPIIKLFH